MGLRPRRAAFLVQRRRGSEQGFTVLETVVALGVILAALVTLAYTANTGFANAAYARQRQTASGLANQTIEQVRALPFDTLKQGMSNFDNLTSDPWIKVVGSDYYFTGIFPNEKIARGDIPLNPAVVPLVPHVQSIKVGTAAIYTVRAFVTYYNNIQTANTYRVSVIVTWTQSARKGYARVNAQSLFFSGSGCLSTSTHPFAAPCQPFLFGSAQGAEGNISITGTFDDVTINDSNLRPGGATSNMQIEQISSIQGTTETSGVSLATNGQPENDAGNQGVTSGADNDPGNPGADFSTATVPAQASTTLSQTAGGGSVYSVTSSGGDSGTTTSTATASLGPPPHPCQDGIGNAQTDSLPCGASKARQLGTEFASLQLWGAAQKIGTTTMASIGPSPADLYVFTNRANAREFSYCPATSGDGCVHADVTRTWGTVALGGLPDNLGAASLPVGWTGYLVTGSNMRTTASAEAGIGSAPPTTTVQGTVSYYNGVGYTPLVLAPGPSLNLVIPPVHAQQLVSGKLFTVDISASLKTGGTQVVDPAGCGTCTRNDASATAASPIVGTITYRFTYDGVTISQLTVKVDLGLTTAKASYKPAPSA